MTAEHRFTPRQASINVGRTIVCRGQDRGAAIGGHKFFDLRMPVAHDQRGLRKLGKRPRSERWQYVFGGKPFGLLRPCRPLPLPFGFGLGVSDILGNGRGDRGRFTLARPEISGGDPARDLKRRLAGVANLHRGPKAKALIRCRTLAPHRMLLKKCERDPLFSDATLKAAHIGVPKQLHFAFGKVRHRVDQLIGQLAISARQFLLAEYSKYAQTADPMVQRLMQQNQAESANYPLPGTPKIDIGSSPLRVSFRDGSAFAICRSHEALTHARNRMA